MNPFVNPKKRDFQLPQGCKDLVDVLRAATQSGSQSKCEYCGAPAVVTLNRDLDDWRWCRECQQDLREFAAIESKAHFKTESEEFPNEAALAQYQAQLRRSLDDFMRLRVKLREWVGKHRKKKPK